jgi:DNA-binding CsgD family transcriptional regulator/tetratricopeptide (TPR) repeat protein
VGIDHPALLVETATTAFHALHLDRAIELNLQAIAELDDRDPRVIDVWLELGRLYRYTSRWDDGSAATSRALTLIPASPPSRARAAALTDAVLGHNIILGRSAEALADAREAVTVAEAVGDPDVVINAHRTLVVAVCASGDHEAALGVALANLERCGPGVSAHLTITAYNCVTGELGDLCRYAEIPAFAQLGVELARASGLGGPRGVWLAVGWIEALVVLGHWDEAEHLVGDVAELVDHPAYDSELAGCWGVALIRQGRLGEARPLIDRARAFLTAIRGEWSESTSWLVAAIVMFDAAEGRHDDAEQLVDDVLAADRPAVDWNNYLVATAIAVLADRAQDRSAGPNDADRDHFQVIATRWVSWMDAADRDGSPPGPKQQLYRDQAHAELDRLRGRHRPEPWDQLAAGWNRLGFRYEEAVARYHHAEALLSGPAGRATHSRAAAANAVVVAHSIGHELGAAPLLADIEALARRARVPLPTPAGSDPRPDCHAPMHSLGLTTREQQVLTLVAAGRSNGEIAKELFISTKTASVHVSNILRKLGVTNRVEAGAVIAQHHHAP